MITLHYFVALGNHRRAVEGFRQLHGIKVLHSPRYTTHGKVGV